MVGTTAMPVAPGRKVRRQNISLQPEEWLALRALREFDRNGSLSTVVGELITAEARRVFGVSWRERIRDAAQEAKESQHRGHE